jgi:2-dehydropantoate 2-reductase
MRFVIAGAGGVGGAIGARLVEAGHDVAWLARGANGDALRRGLRLQSPLGDLELGPQKVENAARELGPADVVIVAVKMYGLAQLARELRPLGEACFLPLQNGIEAHDMLAAALPGAGVLKGMVSVKSHLAAPGLVVCKSGFCRIRFGGDVHPGRLGAIEAALNSGKGIHAAVSTETEADLWRKFVMLTSFSAVSCLARASIGEVLESPDAYGLLLEAAEEAIAVARARGVSFTDGAEELVQSQVRDLPREGRPSMLEDLEAGRPLELEFLSGAVSRLGRGHGVPTPVHTMAYRALAMRRAGYNAGPGKR